MDLVVLSLATLLSGQAQRADSRVIRSLPAARFIVPKAAPRPVRAAAPTRTICGLTMIEPSPDVDARIQLPADRGAGAAVRRIEPQACIADQKR